MLNFATMWSVTKLITKARTLKRAAGRNAVGPYNRDRYKNLVRADLSKNMSEMINRQKTTDLNRLPFVFPNESQDNRRYTVFETFYCIFPPHEPVENNLNRGGSIAATSVREYSAWLNKIRADCQVSAISQSLKSELLKNRKDLVHPDTSMAAKHFFNNNKFSMSGYVMWAEDDSDPAPDSSNQPSTRFLKYVTFVYHRSANVDNGIQIDPNIFTLMESQGDNSTSIQIMDDWSGDCKKRLAEAQRGSETDIMSPVPLDKILYATVTCLLKSAHTELPHHYTHIE